MTRFTSIATAVAASLALSSSALAQQADLAAKLNDEGKELMFAGKFAEASAKFRDAVARVPEPKYFFNLCTSLYQEGKFDEAMTACNAVDKNNPTPDQQQKTQKLIGKIQAEAKSQNLELHPTGGGGGPSNLPPDPNNPPPDPNNPNNPPPPNYTPTVGRAPTTNLVRAQAPLMNKYTWTLGVDLFAGGGQIGNKYPGTDIDIYGNAATGFRIKSDYLLNPASGIGAQGWIGITHFNQGDMQAGGDYTLDIFDIGVGAYKHLCDGSSRMCITPLAGIQLALMSPAGEDDGYGSQVFNYSALGARLEVALTYGLGVRGEHVLSLGLGVNAYSSVFSESMDANYSAEMVGLDKGGAAGYLSIGYMYRFNTPLGSSPFVTLE